MGVLGTLPVSSVEILNFVLNASFSTFQSIMYGKPFKFKVWLSITASLPFAAIFLVLFSEAARKILWERREEYNFDPTNFGGALWLAAGTFTNDGKKL